jgi:predicted dehydrogenase
LSGPFRVRLVGLGAISRRVSSAYEQIRTLISHYSDNGWILGCGFPGVYGTCGAIEEPRSNPDRRTHAASCSVGAGVAKHSFDVADRRARDAHPALLASHVRRDIRDFANAAVHGGAQGASAAYARHVIEIIERGYAAARTGEMQELRTTF